MTCGIYKLSFSGTDKVYIGQSKDIENRFIVHKSSMKHNNTSKALMEAYVLYGPPYLTILCEAPEIELDALEIEAMNIFDSVTNGFNTISSNRGEGTRTKIYGEDSSRCPYTNEALELAFFSLVEDKLTRSEISVKLGISETVLRDIACGRSHSWLRLKYPEEYANLISTKYSRSTKNTDEYNTSSKYSKELIEEVFLYMCSTKNTSINIERIFGIGRDTVSSIRLGRNHKWLSKKYPEGYSKLTGVPIKI